MDVKVLHELFSSTWFIEDSAAKQWSSVLQHLFSNKGTLEDAMSASGLAFSDTRQRFPSSFFKVDANGRYSANGPVQVIVMAGVMMKNDYCGAPGSNSIVNALNAAYEDESVKGVVLFSDCPGGSAACPESIDKAIAARNKPVVTYAELMASAAYWAGSGSDMIIGNSSNKGHVTMIGSIGTMARFIDSREADAKDGFKIIELYATKSTHKNQEYRDVLEGKYDDYIKNHLDPLNETFHDAVKRNRGELNEEVFTGRIYFGQEARKKGLIDKLGTFQDAVKAVVGMASKMKKNNSTMSGQNIAFQNIQNVAGENAVTVVDEGFVMSEESMNKVDEVLGAATTAGALELLNKSKAVQEECDAKIAEMKTAVEAAETRATTAEAKVATLEGELTEAMEHGKNFNAAAKEFFGVAKNDGAPEGESADDAEAILASLPHNQKADAMLPKKSAN